MIEEQQEIINFFEEDTTMPDFFKEEKVRHWLLRIARTYGKEIKNINYIFCSDEYLLQINKEYLDHDYYTDIVTFPYQEGDYIESDIFISIDRVKDNSTQLNTEYNNEFHRVVAHGLLHLCGLGDKTSKEQQEMRQAEDLAISNLI